MKRSISILICIICFRIGFAQIPPGYYNTAAGLTGSALELALHNIIKSHTVVSYASLWTHFQVTDKKASGKVWDMYSDIPGGTPPYQFTFGSDQCGSYSGESDCYNREHTWPQSWFASATTPSSDLFHIYPTDGYVNNIRSNYPYGDVGTVLWSSLNGSKEGFCTDLGYTSTVFEPIDEYKGDLARSYFYMATRYLGEDAAWSSSMATTKAVILPWQVTALLNWSHNDPVSAKETARNNAVYGIQNNRNPFIDHPEWADSIWIGVATGFAEQMKMELAVEVFPNPAAETFFVSNKGNVDFKNSTVVVTNALGQVVETKTNLDLKGYNQSPYEINCKDWKNGVYYVAVSDGKRSKVLKFVKM